LLKNNGWIGAKVVASEDIKDFLSAFYEMRGWYERYQPEYYKKPITK